MRRLPIERRLTVAPACLTLTTDYTWFGGYAGALHAVALRINPGLVLIDADHNVPAHDVRLGALRLERFVRYSPPAVHVAVVDPGVGGPRRAVALAAAGHVFVGPDNGLLLWAAEACCPPPQLRAFSLDREEFWLPVRSRTFDGRDIFVSVGAHIASGTALRDVGTAIDSDGLVRIARPRCEVAGGVAVLEILQVDGFGNVQLSGGADVLGSLGLAPGDSAELSNAGDRIEVTVGSSFGEVGRGEAVLLVDSDDMLAVSVNQGRASEILGRPAGDSVTIRRA